MGATPAIAEPGHMLRGLLAEEGVHELCTLAGSVGVMALHGGLEAGTWEAARRCASRIGASTYAVVQPDGLRWHVPSFQFDTAASATLRRFVRHVSVAVSFHGFGHPDLDGAVLVGGSNRTLATAIGAAIDGTGRATAVTDISSIPRRLRGLHPKNPVNLPKHGGVQLELSRRARSGGAELHIADAVAFAIAEELPSLE
ncbi:MAG TPA: poly-gamma-glutamate hydrolase family protein [Acidimicrobiia bacterium]